MITSIRHDELKNFKIDFGKIHLRDRGRIASERTAIEIQTISPITVRSNYVLIGKGRDFDISDDFVNNGIIAAFKQLVEVGMFDVLTYRVFIYLTSIESKY